MQLSMINNFYYDENHNILHKYINYDECVTNATCVCI